MYSAVDAVDEHGKSYTEYLMRCQWGSNWENMQPWLVARRFREFDALNDLLLQYYPKVKAKMHPLPKKQLFGSLGKDTVEARKRDIEAYMSTIVTHLPSMLKSKYIDGFFNVRERVGAIRKQIEEDKKKGGGAEAAGDSLYNGVVPLAPGSSEELGVSEEERRREQQQRQRARDEATGREAKPLTASDLLLPEEVEARCEAAGREGQRGFDDDELGQAEEKIREFRQR